MFGFPDPPGTDADKPVAPSGLIKKPVTAVTVFPAVGEHGQVGLVGAPDERVIGVDPVPVAVVPGDLVQEALHGVQVASGRRWVRAHAEDQEGAEFVGEDAEVVVHRSAFLLGFRHMDIHGFGGSGQGIHADTSPRW